MRLHVKTTLLATAVIWAMMAGTLWLFGAGAANRLRSEQRNFAKAKAESLAAQIGNLPDDDYYEQIRRLVELLREARQTQDDQDRIRVWERSGPVFVKSITDMDDVSPDELGDEVKVALRAGQKVKIESRDAASGAEIYRVLVPIIKGDRVSGAVEVTEQLDTNWTLLSRYISREIWLALGFAGLSSIIIYLLFRQFVYQPLATIKAAMQQAKVGELHARAQIQTGDEFGELGGEFDRMLQRIEEMTGESNRQNEILAEKVQAATAELQQRNSDLSRANGEVWNVTRRLSELERLAAAGQTAAQFAHEVGTPLNLISGHVQLLQLKANANETEKNRLALIAAQIERIEKIVRAMLDRTKFGETQFEPLDLNFTLKRVIELTQPTFAAKNIDLEFDLAADLPLVRGNADRLEQVFINLASNALDATSKGGTFRICTEFAEGKVVVEFADTGSGMSEETQNRIFEPLFSTKETGRGTGLGLVVVRQILIEHDAEIEVESQLNQGTKFRLIFPAIIEQHDGSLIIFNK